MKQIVLFSALFILITMFSCDKEQEPVINKEKGESSLKFAQSAPSEAAANAVDFTLTHVGIYDKHLYSMVEYIGGNKAHKFSLTWDGNVKNQGDLKIIQLDVYHLTNDDAGTQSVEDSLYIALEKLNIPSELLEDASVRFDVVNTTNTENHFLVTPCMPIVTNPDDIEVFIPTYNFELKVVEAACSDIGTFSNTWLKSTSKDSVLYFIPLEIDDAINYQPTVNDKLKVEFEYKSILDIENADECEFIGKNDVVAIKIRKIEIINE